MGSLPIHSFIRSVAVNTVNPKRVYAAGPAGLFRSDDAGQTWQAADEGVTGEPLAVVLDPVAPQTIFTVLADHSVWWSPDGATSWQLAE